MDRPDRPDRPHHAPADVIPLSAFRAELGRGRRLRRADALLAERDPDAAVRALPGDELYYVLHELGHEDAAPLLAAATAEQLQVVLDFAVWERDRIAADSLADWLEAMAHAPPERIADWLAGLDAELVALILRRGARIYDVTQGPPPEEPEGTFFPTPDTFFVLDVLGAPESDERASRPGAEEHNGVAVMIRLVDSLYRTDMDLARRLLVAASGELDSDLEETAYRWQRGRMADLGFADYYEALEVYRELDLASVRIEDARQPPLRSTEDANGAALRMPTALAQRLTDLGGSPFARAAQKLSAGNEVDELRFALVALTNKVLAADRVAPGDDEAVSATLTRMAATLDLAVERLAPGDDERAAAALRSIPLMRLFRLGVTLIGKVRRLALALVRGGPYGRQGLALAEPDDAAVLEALTRVRPVYPRLLDLPPAAGERPFQRLADLARAAAAIESAAAAQAMVHGLGVEAAAIAPGGTLLTDAGADTATLDAGLLARTALVRRLLGAGGARVRFGALDPDEVRAFESQLLRARSGPPKLPATLESRARALLASVAPPALASAATAVADRWLAGLAPLEPVLVRKASPPSPRKPASRARKRKPQPRKPASAARARKRKPQPRKPASAARARKRKPRPPRARKHAVRPAPKPRRRRPGRRR